MVPDDDTGSSPAAEIARRHRNAVEAGSATYVDPATGAAVFTAAFLTAREVCCGSGCRHCPYRPAAPR